MFVFCVSVDKLQKPTSWLTAAPCKLLCLEGTWSFCLVACVHGLTCRLLVWILARLPRVRTWYVRFFLFCAARHLRFDLTHCLPSCSVQLGAQRVTSLLFQVVHFSTHYHLAVATCTLFPSGLPPTNSILAPSTLPLASFPSSPAPRSQFAQVGSSVLPFESF